MDWEAVLTLWAAYGPLLAILLGVGFYVYNKVNPTAIARPRPTPIVVTGRKHDDPKVRAGGGVRQRHRAAAAATAAVPEEPRGWGAAKSLQRASPKRSADACAAAKKKESGATSKKERGATSKKESGTSTDATPSSSLAVCITAVTLDNPSALEWRAASGAPFEAVGPRDLCNRALPPVVSLRYRGNEIILNATNSTTLTASINGKGMGDFVNPTSLSLKKMAVCIGDDICVLWPPRCTPRCNLPAVTMSAPSVGPADVGSPCFLEALSPTILNPQGQSVPTAELRGQVIGLYFSASWCGPCKQFTPFLCEWLDGFKREHPLGCRLAVVFVSRDHTEVDFNSYRREMNFYALPFQEAQRFGADLGDKYGVKGIPALPLLQNDGIIITTDGRLQLSTDYDPPGQGFPWSALPMSKLCGERRSNTAANVITTPTVISTYTVSVSRTASGRTLSGPTTAPISSVHEVLRWSPGNDPFSIATVPLRPRSKSLQARLTVCHDMMGGYTAQDRNPQGSLGDGDVYRIYHWHLIDSFIYFSHNLVSIPTPGWTNTAHRNGVKVLGTFITEWEAGAEACVLIFASMSTAEAFAKKLVEIAQYYGFDGWLVNIENPLGQTRVPILKHFLTVLTSRMHTAVPNSLVMWYDAVTTDGDLQHQNMLTSKNLPFFDLVDEVFLNYWWDPNALQRSRATAGERMRSVYAGIDVFGRNTFGGGGMSSGVAVEAIKSAGVSAALFAPGWVFEDEQFDKKKFDENQAQFWVQFEDGTFPRRALSGLPLVTTFCAGSGYRYVVSGHVVSHKPWANLSEQSIQLTEPSRPKLNPYFPVLKDHANAADTFLFQPASLNYERAFDGGSCLAIRGAVRVNANTLARKDRAVFKLIATEVQLAAPVCVCLTYSVNKSAVSKEPVAPSVVLVCTTTSGTYQYLTLHCNAATAPTPLESTPDELELATKLMSAYKMLPSRCAERTSGKVVYLETKDAGPIGAHDSNGWHTACFVLCDQQLKSLTVREIRLNLTVSGKEADAPQPVAVDVGALRMFKVGTSKVANVVSNICLDSESWTKTATRSWRLGGVIRWSVGAAPGKIAFFDVWLEDDKEWTFVGRSYTDRLYFSDIAPTEATRGGCVSMRFAVQSCNAGLCRFPLEECPTLIVKCSER